MNKKKLKSTASRRCLMRSSFENSENLWQKTSFLPESLSAVFSKEDPVSKIFINTCFDKNHLKTVIAWFLEKYGEKKTVDLVETLKQVGFHQATRAGVSLGIDDLEIPPQKAHLLSEASVKMLEVNQALTAGNLTNVEKSQRLIDTWNQTSETLRQAAVQNFRTTNPVNPVFMMAFSGARGNISQVRQLVAMRGLMADPQGAILEFPICSNFREGLTVTEYLISCFGARKGLVDTALRTATSGYLTRRLVDAVQHVVIHVTNCHTTKGLLLKGKNLEQKLLGRVLLKDLSFDSSAKKELRGKTLVKKNTLISGRLAKQIAEHHKEIFVRSPLTCQTEKSVCQLCYGLDLAQGKLVSLGEAVGIIAAQSIGEPGTQLTMRTFHTGGVGVFSDQAMKPLSAPFPGKIDFLSSLPGLFVRTLHGNIVYLLKHKSTENHQIFLRLTGFESSSTNGGKTKISGSSSSFVFAPFSNGPTPTTQKLLKNQKEEVEKTSFFREKQEKMNSLFYEIKHGEVPAGSLLWVKQGECVKGGQLLIQASHLQASRQEMPESTHPVRAALSGEVFFESIKTRRIEKGKLVKKKTIKNPLIHTKEKISKEITPTIPFLRELGTFWVFSCFVQKEMAMENLFLRRGDLISPETPLQQYDFQVSSRGQLKQAPSVKVKSLVFTEPAFQSRIFKIHYSQKFYFFITAQQNLFSYTTNSRSTGLTWYPFFQTFQVGEFTKKDAPLSYKNHRFQKGYCLRLPFRRDDTFSEKGINERTNENSEKIPEMSYLWAPHKVFYSKKIQHFFPIELSSGFLFFETGTVSKTGLFQFHSFPFLKKTPSEFSHFSFFKGGSETRTLKTEPGSYGVPGPGPNGSPSHKGNSFHFSGLKTEMEKNPNDLNSKTKKNKGQENGKRRGVVWSKSNIFKTSCIKNDLTWCWITKNASGKLQRSTKMNRVHFRRPLNTALKRVQKILTPPGSFEKKLIEKKQGWFYVSDISLTLGKSQLLGVVLEPGKKFENISFSKSYVSLHLLSTKNVFLFKMKEKQPFFGNDSKKQTRVISTKAKTPCFWEPSSLLSKEPFFSLTRNFLTWSPSTNFLVSKRDGFFKRQFCFFKSQDFQQRQKTNLKKLEKTPFFCMQKKRRLSHLVFIQKNFYQILPDRQLLYQKYVLENTNSFPFVVNSPFFAKQFSSQKRSMVQSGLNKKNHRRFELVSPPFSGWMSTSSFFKVDLEFQSSKIFAKLDEFQHKISALGFHSETPKKGMPEKPVLVMLQKNGYLQKQTKSILLTQGVSVLFSRPVQLENAETYRFQTFQDGWVLPQFTVTRGFLLSKKLGEFHRMQKKQDNFRMSLLQTQNLVSLKLPGVLRKPENTDYSGASENFVGKKVGFFQNQKKSPLKGVGARVRWGQELVDGFAVCSSGQILKITTKNLTLRKGTPLLASLRGLLHVTQGDMIQKNDILITLRSRRLQTEDIVQGIPKIEQLFEARETQGGELLQNNMHMLLKKFFHRALGVKTVPAAVELSVMYIQKFLVENILQAYSNQGVHIAEKHVEIVVRQMTSRIRITHGGDSGFLPGEFVQLRVIEKINDGLALAGHRPADYEPMILGITKSVLQSESFLLAASFQQVSKVLVRSALAKKTDFLRGLHENLLVGQPIPAGTGIVSVSTSSIRDPIES